MLPPPPQQMLTHALSGTPDVLEALLAPLSSDDAAWDFRPFDDRWTLREMTAHLADMETVWHARVVRTLSGNEPFLPNVDEEKMALEHHYNTSEPLETLRLFRQRRTELVHRLRGLDAPDWQREAQREHIGRLSLLEQLQYVLMHDCYHTQQVVHWLQARA